MVSTAEVRNAIVDVLGTGALSVESLVKELAADGSLSPAATLLRDVRSVIQRATSFAEVGDRICYVPALADGVRWTVSVDPDDASEDFVKMHPALDAVGWWLVEEGADLVDAMGAVVGRIEVDDRWLDERETDIVTGPPGWLAAAAGGWASFTVHDGKVQLEALQHPPEPTARQVAAFRSGFESTVEHNEVVLVSGELRDVSHAFGGAPMLGALLADRGAFVDDSVPHVPDLVAAAGFEQRGDLIAEPGFDWPAYGQWQRRNRLRALHRLDDADADAALQLLDAIDRYASDGESALGDSDDARHRAARALVALLERPEVGRVVWREAVPTVASVGVLASFADALAERVGGDAHAGLAWLRATCAEALGDVRTAVALLDEIATTGSTHKTALCAAAAVAADRGDVPAAARLLRRAGADVAPADGRGVRRSDEAAMLWFEIAPYEQNRPRPAAGRNEPCPCGSGRKYKACHLGREQHSLDDRASWLYDKAVRYLRNNEPEMPDELAHQLSVTPRIRRELRTSPFTVDLALHEHGLFAEFIEERGWLLPDDEQLLAAQWALVDRGVFEIVEGSSSTLTLRDIGRSETLTVVNATRSLQSRPGVIMVGRPLPVGDTHRALGGFIAISPSSVNTVLDAIATGDAEAVVEAIATCLRPPRVQNTSGEDIAFHTMRWAVDDLDAIDAQLTAAGLERGGDGEWSLTADTANMRNARLASVRVDEQGTLVGEANSDERAEMLRELIASAFPHARLVDDERDVPGDGGLFDDDDDDDFDE